MEASKEGRSFTDFKYACVGYSVYLDKKDSSSDDTQSKQAELPFCVGLEVKYLGTQSCAILILTNCLKHMYFFFFAFHPNITYQGLLFTCDLLKFQRSLLEMINN